MTSRADDRPPTQFEFKGIHMEPEEVAFFAMLLLEVVGTLWQQERAKWAMRKVTMQRSLEYALGHEGGFTALFRQSRVRRR